MSEEKTTPQAEEQSLVKLYAELTGASELSSRAVFMHISDSEPEKTPPAEGQPHAANPPS